MHYVWDGNFVSNYTIQDYNTTNNSNYIGFASIDLLTNAKNLYDGIINVELPRESGFSVGDLLDSNELNVNDTITYNGLGLDSTFSYNYNLENKTVTISQPGTSTVNVTNNNYL